VIVTDASAIAELLLARPDVSTIRTALAPHTELHVPEHFHSEVLSVLRRHLLTRRLSEVRAERALADLAALRVITYPVVALMLPIWRLRANLSVYDAAYLALARRLDVGLITLDAALADAAARDGRLVSV
jgi:predicted nucleic acid-binding protein